ncbi:endonuclease domain-containing protein [Gracilimonas sp.]|uniref:endonuclease domain-containing protein n=1 Tax=Gracilimonas sp. TaxID=1974203 RepID=UPI003D0BF83F
MSRNSAFNYYNKDLRPNARSLRKNMTKAEVCLWKYGLRKKQRMGYTFNRQRPVLNYIADFMCKKLKLIIEVDGSSHDSPEAFEYDQRRQRHLEEAGFKVIRFRNKDVLTNMDAVLMAIDKVILELENGAES